MKKAINVTLLSVMSVASITSLALINHNQTVYASMAYTKEKLTTTISLRDNLEEEIRNYYKDLNDKNYSGTDLLINLKKILSNGQKYYSYDTGKDDIWKMYEIIDRDWVKSPAKDIAGYDASTNTITNYAYKTDSDIKTTYIHALYVNRDVENMTTAWGDHQQTQWGINQEHIWPKSQGFNTDGVGGARGDPMHLWAGNGRINGAIHNDHAYGFIDRTKDYTDGTLDKKGQVAYPTLKGNDLGISSTLSSAKNKVFEPQDSDKGDIARAIFYMVARYNNLAKDDTIDSNNPNLELVQTDAEYAAYTSTSTETGKMGILSDLLVWNKLDPVDEFEIHRNNLLFNNYTNNRNPFIDFPEWADYIWGTAEYDKTNNKSINFNTTVTGSANPKTDAISKKGSAPVAPTTPVTPEPTVAPTPSGEKKSIDMKTIIIIVAVAAVVVILLIVVLAKMSKKNRKKVLKAAKKGVKTYNKNNSKKGKK